MTKRIIAVFMCILLTLAVFSGCGSGKVEPSTAAGSADVSDTDSPSDKPVVVATIFPAYDFVRQIAGELVDFKMLMKPGGEVHSYSPTAEDMLVISKCDLFISVGGESDEGWVADTLASVDKQDVTAVKMIDCVTTFTEEHKEGMEEEEHGDAEEIASGAEDEHEEEIDEHVWTSPVNAVLIVKEIADKLSAIDSANTDSYNANAQAYIDKLNELDAAFKQISATAKYKTLVFADRFPFRYFTEEYGFDYFAAFAGCSASADPSAQTISFLTDKVKQLNLPFVVTIEFSTGATADTIIESTGVKRVELNSCHNVSQEQFNSGVTYVDLMNKNVEVLKEVLECYVSD